MKNIPFSIFALVRFPGVRIDEASYRTAGPLDLYDLDEGIASLKPRVDVTLPRHICPDGEVSLAIAKVADLKPHNLVRCSEYLLSLADALAFVKTNRHDPEATAAGLHERFGHLPLDLSVLAPPPEPAGEGSAIDSLLSKVALPGEAEAGPVKLDAQLEDMLKTALQRIFADDDFRQLEATLRGLEMLVREGPVKKSAKVNLFLVPFDSDTLEAALRHIVRTSSTQSPSLVLVDLPFDNSFASVDNMETITNFSEAVSTPTAVCLAPAFFGLEKWGEIDRLGYLAHELGTQPFAKFRALASAPAARWLTCCLPRVCVRDTYESADEAPRPVGFKERSPVWTSPVFALGTLAVKSQNAFGWPTRLSDHNHCRVGELVIPKRGGHQAPLATLLKEDRVSQLQEIGMAPLRSVVGGSEAFLPKAPTAGGGALGYQLFVNRVVGFFYNQKDRLAAASDIRDAQALVTTLEARFLEAWAETGQSAPEDVVIGVAHEDPMGEVVLSIRMTPPRALVPAPQLFEFEISFGLG